MRAHKNRDRIRIGVWAAAALPIALLAGLLIERSPAPGAPAGAAQVDPEGTRVDLGRAELEALRRELASVRADVTRMLAESAQLLEPAGADPAPAPRDRGELDPEEPGPPERPDIAQIEADLELEQLAYEDRLREEGDDWAEAKGLETELMRSLGEGSIRATANARCGQTLCRVNFAFEDAIDLEDQFHDIPNMMPWTGEGFATIDAEDPRRAIVYVALEGESLPELP
jgi:hypothetical protein